MSTISTSLLYMKEKESILGLKLIHISKWGDRSFLYHPKTITLNQVRRFKMRLENIRQGYKNSLAI